MAKSRERLHDRLGAFRPKFRNLEAPCGFVHYNLFAHLSHPSFLAIGLAQTVPLEKTGFARHELAGKICVALLAVPLNSAIRF
jgi:hypothetical protein